MGSHVLRPLIFRKKYTILLFALVAQLDRAPAFEAGCRRFESCRAHHFSIQNHAVTHKPSGAMNSEVYLYGCACTNQGDLCRPTLPG